MPSIARAPARHIDYDIADSEIDPEQHLSPHSSTPQSSDRVVCNTGPRKGTTSAQASPSAKPSFSGQTAQLQETARSHESFAAQSTWPHPFGSFEEQDYQVAQGGSRPALADASHGSALGDARDWQPPQQELGRFIPPGMNEASYVAGERAALLRAFRETLPSQQALGSLFHAVQHLTRRMDQEGSDVHQVQIALSSLSATLQAAKGRLDALEQMRIPTLEERLHEVSTTSAQDFQTALNAFGETMAATMAHQTAAQSTYLAAGFRQIQWLLATFGNYAQRALCKADVAVMFVSRKILVDQTGLAAIGSSLPVYYRQPTGQGPAQPWPVMYSNGHLVPLQEPRSIRAVLGAMLFLAAVESGWQLHHRTVQYLPKNLQAAVSPMQLGLRILRGAVWTAALTVSAVKTRHVCYNTADALVSVFVQLHQRYKPARRKSRLDDSSATTKDSMEAVCSVDVNACGAELLEAKGQGGASDSES